MILPKPPLTTDQQDVLRVIEADLTSYLARDKSTWEQSWLHSDMFKSIMECGPLQIADGYDAFRQNVFAAMEAEPTPVQADIQRENLQIHIQGDVAWATFEQLVTETDNPHALGMLSHNMRLLVRSEGAWRIVFHGVWAQTQRDTTAPTLEVSATCEVIWMNPQALHRLRTFPGLQVSHGILRAATPSLDRALRDQIARAHTLTAFAHYNRAASEGGGSVTFPVVLGEDDDGALLICWVKVSDGRVYVSFGDTPNLDRQIEVAQVIYGLSETQTRIVARIANGLDLAGIATDLSITPNTVKTHLKRIFDKVGVNSQVDLLRRLVSFGL